MTVDELTKQVIGCAYRVHNEIGGGILEKGYENVLRIELTKFGIDIKQQYPIPVYYHDELVGNYYADLLVNGCLILELKAVQNMTKEHEVQLVNYLAATGINDDLLINFGSLVEVKRKFRLYTKKQTDPNHRSKYWLKFRPRGIVIFTFIPPNFLPSFPLPPKSRQI